MATETDTYTPEDKLIALLLGSNPGPALQRPPALAPGMAQPAPALPAGMPPNYGVTDNFGTGNATYGPVATPTPAIAPAAAPMGPQAIAAPTALPQYAQVDMARRKALEQAAQQSGQPLDASRPDLKPKWWEIALGLAAGAAMGAAHNPNAGELGGDLIKRRFNKAESKRQQQHGADVEALDQFDKNASDTERNNRSARDQFRDTIDLNKAQNTFDSDAYQRDGKWYKRSQTGQEVAVAEPKSVAEERRKNQEDENSPAPGARPTLGIDPDTKKPTLMIKTKSGKLMPYTPKSVEEGYILGDQRSTAGFMFKNRDKAGDRADKPKRGTPAQFEKANSDKNKAIMSAKSEYDDDLRMAQGIKDPTKRDAAMRSAHDRYLDSWQSAEDSFGQNVTTLGGNYTPYDVRSGSGGKNQQQATAQSASKAAPSQKSAAKQPMVQAGQQVSINGQPKKIVEVRRNPQTGEHAYKLDDNTWVRDSQLSSKTQ